MTPFRKEQIRFLPVLEMSEGFTGALVVKNPTANAGDIRDTGLIPGSGRSPGEGSGNPVLPRISSILAWRIPSTEEPGGLQSLGSQ